MSSGTHVKDHVMTMENYFNEAEICGSTLDEPTQMSIILISLSKDFNHLISNYVMHHLNYGMSQLMNELHTYELICGIGKVEGEATPSPRREIRVMVEKVDVKPKTQARSKRQEAQ